MSNTDVIREFLVSLGWSHDEQSRRKVVDAEKKTTRELGKEQKERDVFDKKRKESTREAIKGFQELSIGVTAAAGAIVGVLGSMGKAFESAYYSASRTGSSTRELKAFQYAMSQMGSSAEEAQAAVEGMATAIRNNPGLRGVLANLGAKNPDDMTKSIMDIAPKLSAMPIATAEAFARMYNIPEKVLLAIRQVNEVRAKYSQGDNKYGILGFDPGKAADDGAKLTQAFRDLGDTMAKISEKAGSSLFRDLEPQLKSLNDFLLAHGKEISETATKIGDALFAMFSYVVKHIPDIDHFATSIGGWTNVLNGLAAAVSVAMIGRVASLFASLGGIAAMAPPGWMLALLGVAGYAGYQALKGQGPSSGAEGSYQENRAAERNHPGESGLGRLWRKGKHALGIGGRRGFMTRGKGHAPYVDHANYTGSNANVVRQAAAQLGTTPEDLATVISYETKGTFSPSIHGGYSKRYGAGAYHGLIQFGPPEQAMYGVRDDQTFAQQMHSVVSYLKDRGYKPGMSLLDLYSTVNAGSPGHGNWSDSNGPIWAHVERMKKQHAGNVQRFLGAPLKTPPMMKAPFLPRGLNSLPTFANPPAIGGGGGFNPNNVSMVQHNNVTISGVSDPTTAAAHIGARQNRSNSQLFRNLQSAVG